MYKLLITVVKIDGGVAIHTNVISFDTHGGAELAWAKLTETNVQRPYHRTVEKLY